MLNKLIHRLFRLKEYNTNIKTEIFAGLTTYLSCAYILFVNPSILSHTGMDIKSLFMATALSVICGCILMALIANLPIAIAPAMGSNSWFTFTVVLTLGFTWQQGLAAIFVGAILFLIFTATKLRQYLIDAFSDGIKLAIGAGIGLFITSVGLKNGHILDDSPATFTTLNDPFSLPFIMTIIGILLITVLEKFKIIGSLLITIFTLSITAFMYGASSYTGTISVPPSIAPTFFQMDFSRIFEVSFIAVALSVFLIDFLDSTGAFVSMSPHISKEGMKDKRIKRALFVDGASSLFASSFGSSTVAPYIESTTGIKYGGRTGLTALVVALFFLVSILFSPLLTLVPTWATAPILIYVGFLMFKTTAKKINWENSFEGIPCFLIIFLMPFTSSIAHGIGIGIITWLILSIFNKTFNLRKHWILLLISAGYIVMLCNL